MANFNDGELEELLCNDSCELEACQSFLSYFINDHNNQTMVNFATDTLENVLRNNLTTDTKWVLLYLHNGNDVFSSKFCEVLKDKKVEDILGDSAIFTVIAWDTSAEYIWNALKKAIRATICDAFSDYVSSDRSVALLIDSSRNVCRLCDDEKKLASFINVLENYQEVTHTYNGDNAFDLREEINPTNFQQRMFDLLGDRDYDSFEPDQHDLLRFKIGYHLYGPPDVELPGTANKDVSVLQGTYSSRRAQETINEILKKIITENNKFCRWDGRVVINFIYICVEPLAKEKQKKKAQNQDYKPESDYNRIPLFVIRKCKGQQNNGPLCRLIIDNRCRVYTTWNDYLKNSNLGPCLMVCPKQGKYQSLNNHFEILLEEHFSIDTSQKKFNVQDTFIVNYLVLGFVVYAAAAVAGLGGLAVGIAAAACVIGAIQKLFRENGMGNEKSFDRSSRLLVYGLNARLLGINGLGMGSNMLQMYRENLQPIPLHIVQLGTAIFFFGNTLYNFRSIGTLTESEAIALSKIEFTLSCNRKRRMYNKMSMEIMHWEGNTAGKPEVISPMRNMDNSHEVFRILNQNNRNFDNAGFRFSMQDGNIFLNERQLDIMDISKMSTYDRSFLRSLLPIPSNLTPNVRDALNTEFNTFLQENRRLLQATSTLVTTGDVPKFVREVLSAFEPLTRQFIYILSQSFIRTLSQEGIVEGVARLFPDTDIFFIILRWMCNTLGGIPAFEKISNDGQWDDADINSIREDLMRAFLTWFSDIMYDQCYREDRKARRRENNREKERINCTSCCGYFYT